ncbi:MAG: hypothetical protein AAGC73_03180 [Verrucomicrobiota bacterium]
MMEQVPISAYVENSGMLYFARMLEGRCDEPILNLCFENERELDEDNTFIWNQFLKKLD